jgi:hypothetical protein
VHPAFFAFPEVFAQVEFSDFAGACLRQRFVHDLDDAGQLESGDLLSGVLLDRLGSQS